jgi:hypothetical protein
MKWIVDMMQNAGSWYLDNPDKLYWHVMFVILVKEQITVWKNKDEKKEETIASKPMVSEDSDNSNKSA